MKNTTGKSASYIRISTSIILMLALLLTLFFVGARLTETQVSDTARYRSYSNIPGVAKDEIKAIEHDGIQYLTELYNLGMREYHKHKLITRLTEEERDYIKNNPVISFMAQQRFFWLFGAVALLMCVIVLVNLSRAKKRLERESRFKSQFLAIMSHEIRTPMNAIIGIAQIELNKGDLQDEYALALGKIYNSSNNLLRIINDILDMSKIETGKLELSPSEYYMPSLINDTVQLNIVRIGSKQIEFELDIDENLPTRLNGDELRLKQILNNLLSNAIKYTEKGRVKLSINHLIQGDEIELHFTVEDTGQGMMPEDQKRLFIEFIRFNEKANHTTEGTGLGLFITKRLVEMMGGTIKVESEYGRGSVFTVTLKQKAVECPSIGIEIAEQLCSFNYADNSHIKKTQLHHEPMPYGSVLIVDDVETNLFVAEGLLRPYKLKIEMVTSGFAAIDKVKSGNTYDVIFMDHMMPQMDGIETTKRVRDLGYTGIILALTANALLGNGKMFMQNGFDGYIPKPIDMRQLNAFLNKFIRDRHPEEAKKYKPERKAQPETLEINPKILQVFRRDAEKAIVTMRETIENDDIKLFTITAHAMKSALANIGEKEASGAALDLEKAGLNGDLEYISANMELFIETLETLIKRLKTPDKDNTNIVVDIIEDTEYLTEQLQIIKTACNQYDDDTAYAALDRLKERSWNTGTTEVLEQIRDALYIYSDFDGTAKRIVELRS